MVTAGNVTKSNQKMVALPKVTSIGMQKSWFRVSYSGIWIIGIVVYYHIWAIRYFSRGLADDLFNFFWHRWAEQNGHADW